MTAVAKESQEALLAFARGNQGAMMALAGLRENLREETGLDGRTFGLVKLAALVALDAPEVSYAWHVANAVEDGATPEDIVGVLRAVAPQVGGPRVVAAAPGIMLALGLALPDDAE